MAKFLKTTLLEEIWQILDLPLAKAARKGHFKSNSFRV